MTNTTWNPADLAGVTLSGGNLIATSTGTGCGVRAKDKQVSGKFYWECTLNTNGSTWNFGVGVVGGETSLSYLAAGGLASPSITVDRANGFFWVNAGPGVAMLGGIATGTTVCIAADFTNKLIWFRSGAAGNWNGNATNDPATGIGGRSIAAITPLNWYPFAGFSNNISTPNVVANFGDSAFAGAVPAGFTAGFTAGASPPNIAADTQIVFEQWSDGGPVAQATQIAVEQWGPAGTTVPLAVLTQIGIEHWATVLPTSARVTQIAVEQWAKIKHPPQGGITVMYTYADNFSVGRQFIHGQK